MVQLVWIGLGNMGRGMVKNLVNKGKLDKPLILYNRTAKRATDMSASLPEGKTVVETKLDKAVAKGDIIYTCIGDDAAVSDTFDAALKIKVTGKLFVECSTIHPDTTAKLAKRTREHGADFVASPVFGAPPAADAGQLVCVLAGEPAAIDKIRPYCTGVMGRDIIDLSGHLPEKASVLKVIGNTAILQMVESLAEGHVLAEKSCIGTDKYHEVISKVMPGPAVAYSNRMIQGTYHKRDEPLFAVDLARKDARHAMDLAKSAGTRMKAVEVADGHLAAAQQHQGSKGDMTSIYGVVRQGAGLKFEN